MIKEAVEKLGLQAKDKVTGFTGMVSSVCFDAYGCVMVSLTPEAKEGKLGDSSWMDIKRMEFGKRVMPEATFATQKLGDENGPAEKPAPR